MKQLRLETGANYTDLNQLSNRISILKEKIDVYRAEGLWLLK